MYTLYIANKNYSSWSLRPWCLMKEFSIPFEEKLYPFQAAGNLNTFKTFSPTGQVPCLKDGDISVWDSLAIVEYLAERHSTVWHHDATARAWSRCASAEMHSGFPTLRLFCSMNCSVTAKLHKKTQTLTNEIQRIEELWNDGLSRFGGPFLAGSTFTAVDAFYAPMVFRHRTYQIFTDKNAIEYCQNMLTIQSIKTWMDEALAEKWVDTGHEKEAMNYSVITEDRRKNTEQH